MSGRTHDDEPREEEEKEGISLATGLTGAPVEAPGRFGAKFCSFGSSASPPATLSPVSEVSQCPSPDNRPSLDAVGDGKGDGKETAANKGSGGSRIRLRPVAETPTSKDPVRSAEGGSIRPGLRDKSTSWGERKVEAASGKGPKRSTGMVSESAAGLEIRRDADSAAAPDGVGYKMGSLASVLPPPSAAGGSWSASAAPASMHSTYHDEAGVPSPVPESIEAEIGTVPIESLHAPIDGGDDGNGDDGNGDDGNGDAWDAPGAYRIRGIDGTSRSYQWTMHSSEKDDSSVALGLSRPLAAHVVMEGGVGGGDSMDDGGRSARRNENDSAAILDLIRRDDATVIEGRSVRKREDGNTNEKESIATRWQSFIRHHIVAFVLCAATLAVGATLAASLVPATTEKEGADDSAVRAPAPTTAPTSERHASVKALLQAGLVGGTELDDESSSQGKALMWLVNDDGRSVGLDDMKGLLQRFVLATLYFSTGGNESWANTFNFLSPAHECNWNGVAQDGSVEGVFCSDGSATIENITMPMNNMSGSIPREIGTLARLEWLGLQFNDLTGTIPLSLGYLTELQYLDLADASLTGPIPPTLGELHNLRHVSMEQNFLSGTIPSSLGDLTELKYLRLRFNNLIGPIPQSLGKLSELRELQLAGNQLTGTIPEINNLPELEVLSLRDNYLNGTIPFAENSLPNLQILSVRNNSITGTFPDSIISYRRLEQIDLGANNLSGTLPPKIGNLSDLVLFDVGYNFFSGTIPTNVFSLVNLLALNLEVNFFSGTIPQEVGLLQDLRFLHLFLNRISGSIPDTVGNLTALKELYLGENHLTSLVPESIAKLTSLSALDIANNSIVGDINFLCDSVDFILADCHGDNPEVLCDCCEECCSDEKGFTGDGAFGCFRPKV